MGTNQKEIYPSHQPYWLFNYIIPKKIQNKFNKLDTLHDILTLIKAIERLSIWWHKSKKFSSLLNSISIRELKMFERVDKIVQRLTKET